VKRRGKERREEERRGEERRGEERRGEEDERRGKERRTPKERRGGTDRVRGGLFQCDVCKLLCILLGAQVPQIVAQHTVDEEVACHDH